MVCKDTVKCPSGIFLSSRRKSIFQNIFTRPWTVSCKRSVILICNWKASAGFENVTLSQQRTKIMEHAHFKVKYPQDFSQTEMPFTWCHSNFSSVQWLVSLYTESHHKWTSAENVSVIFLHIIYIKNCLNLIMGTKRICWGLNINLEEISFCEVSSEIVGRTDLTLLMILQNKFQIQSTVLCDGRPLTQT